MDEKNKGLERYAQAVSCLPPRLMHLALGLPETAGLPQAAVAP